MITNPTFSFASLGLKSSFTVVVNSFAGHFCINTLGTNHKFFAVSDHIAENKRNLPLAGNAQNGLGFACHCHCSPMVLPLNSSDSCGVCTGYTFPTFGFLYSSTGSPFPSPSLSTPITGQLFTHFIGCR